MLNRRSLITGLISLVTAPAIVRVANIMPVKPWQYGIIKIGNIGGDVVWTADSFSGLMMGDWNAGFWVKGIDCALGVEKTNTGWSHILGKSL